MSRRPLHLFVLIDALGWRFLEDRKFLSDILPYRTPLRTVLGFSSGAIPTILTGVNPAGEIAGTEIFGPVLTLMHVKDVDEAIELVNRSKFGNQACLFTRSAAAARKFRYEAEVGNIGINLGVAAPMAFFPFSGWKDSFFGDLHGQGRDAVEFYTEKKVVVERWPAEWSRTF